MILSASAPELPHTTGPMAGTSEPVTTAAPAPSAKMMQLARSVWSTHWDIFSDPMTSTLRAEPLRIASLAFDSA